MHKRPESSSLLPRYVTGLGKTFTGSEKIMELDARINLVICQKSKVDDWVEHFRLYKDGETKRSIRIYDCTNLKDAELESFIYASKNDYTHMHIGVINYDLLFRRPTLLELDDFTLLLDESSLIQNPTAKRTKTVMKMSPKNVILLSGTPTGGKYERLITQMNLLGWNVSEEAFWNRYVNWHWSEEESGFFHKVVDGYKNETRMKKKMKKYGCHFLKTDEVFDLPDQINQKIEVPISENYFWFHRNDYLEIEGKELMGDTILNKMLYERQLCGQYSKDKIDAFYDLLISTNDRLIVFYNFTAELTQLTQLVSRLNRPISIINGQEKDLTAYKECENSITFIQYQAGAMGLNLQEANKIIYFTPPLSSELFEQSKKRIHRIGQNKSCFYYYMICRGSIESKIYKTLAMRRDYTEALFERGD